MRYLQYYIGSLMSAIFSIVEQESIWEFLTRLLATMMICLLLTYLINWIAKREVL